MRQESSSKSGDYWKEHVISWEASAYFKDGAQQPAFWDRLSTFFRGGGMYVRMEAALRMVKPYVKDRSVLDIGCASGRFAFQLMEAGARKVTGLDVSPAAIEAANQNRLASPYADRMEFRVMDLTQPDAALPQVDLVTALGVIEYFDSAELDSMMSHMKTRYFLFDFPDSEGRRKDWSTWQLRRVYLWLNHCPGVHLYGHDEFNAMAAKYGYRDIWYARHATFYYASNLPHA
ncbi:MAG TPA: class I SAM-dependent methyltransferase [Anaerolineales bacterium]|nr:class I SAM-dependent methyltransferase [Anaerolineales bacterium]